MRFFKAQSGFMDIRSRKTRKTANKAVQYLNETEKTQLAIRAAFARNKTRQDASRNALGVVKPAIRGKLIIKPKQSS
jgi:hypothetical protein